MCVRCRIVIPNYPTKKTRRPRTSAYSPVLATPAPTVPGFPPQFFVDARNPDLDLRSGYVFSRQIFWQHPSHMLWHLTRYSTGLLERLELRRSASMTSPCLRGRRSYRSGKSPRLCTDIARFHPRQERRYTRHQSSSFQWCHNPIHSTRWRGSRTNFAEGTLAPLKPPKSLSLGYRRESAHTRRNRRGHILACRSTRQCRSPRYTPSVDWKDRQSAHRAQVKQAIPRGAWSKTGFRRCSCQRAHCRGFLERP